MKRHILPCRDKCATTWMALHQNAQSLRLPASLKIGKKKKKKLGAWVILETFPQVFIFFTFFYYTLNDDLNIKLFGRVFYSYYCLEGRFSIGAQHLFFFQLSIDVWRKEKGYKIPENSKPSRRQTTSHFLPKWNKYIWLQRSIRIIIGVVGRSVGRRRLSCRGDILFSVSCLLHWLFVYILLLFMALAYHSGRARV